MRTPAGLRIDSPSWPLLQAHISYWGITSAVGLATGTTLECADLANEPSYVGLSVKILDGGAAGQVRAIQAIVAGVITVAPAFTNAVPAAQQIAAGTRFVILSAAGAGGVAPVVAPSIGLWMFGVCAPAMVASTTVLVMPNLAGFPDDIFNDEFWCQVISNADAPATAPEREIRRITDYVGATGTFTTDAFSVPVQLDDLVAVFHESIMGIEVMGFGTLDTSSATVPADSLRAGVYAWENNDYFKGCLLVPTEGLCRLQARPIRTFAVAGGIFTLDEPFSQAPGAVDYVIVSSAYPVQRLLDIFTLVNAMLALDEYNGILLSTAAEQNVYVNDGPAGSYKPIVVKIDLDLMVGGDTIVIRLYDRLTPGVAWWLTDYRSYTGADGGLLNGVTCIYVTMQPNRYGARVTLQRTGGADHNYQWEALVDQ